MTPEETRAHNVRLSDVVSRNITLMLRALEKETGLDVESIRIAHAKEYGEPAVIAHVKLGLP